MDPCSPGRLPDGAYAAALASLVPIGPARLRSLLAEGDPGRVWSEVLTGHRLDGDGSWRAAAAVLDPAALWDRHRRAGVGVLLRHHPGYPTALADDPGAPAVLFCRGEPAVLGDRPRAAVVGTRSATRYGLGVAAQLGTELAVAGVCVVSGLAPGIDGAAHEGALAGRRAAGSGGGAPVGVVVGPLDRPHPRPHARLWDRVADVGLLLSEAPLDLGAVPRWRFPQRNRLLAALSDVVVVVESHVTGASLATARAAERRGISVGAVPGSIRSPASAGTNDLLADGCFVVRDAADVLVAVDLARPGPVAVRRSDAATATVPAGRPTVELGPLDRRVLAALEWEPRPLEDVLTATGDGLGEVAAALERLSSLGLVGGESGWWVRR
ncbi:MAG: DNA-processing protein DprA [Acidimicrobiales bacterium]